MSKSFETYINEFIETLPVSKPVFISKIEKDSLYFELKDRLFLDINDYVDPVDQLIVSNCSESFRKVSTDFESKYTRSCSVQYVFEQIKGTIINIYLNNCGLKNPKASNLYRFLNYTNHNSDIELVNGLVMLYRYACVSVKDTRAVRIAGLLEKAHANNVLAILGKMKDKYDR